MSVNSVDRLDPMDPIRDHVLVKISVKPELSNSVRGLLVIFALVIAKPLDTHASPSLGILGGVKKTTTQTSGSALSSDGSRTPIFGAYLEGPIMPWVLDAEIGALVSQQKLSATAGSVTATTSFRSLQLPVMLKFVGLPLVWAGAGVFTTVGIGDISTEYSTPAGNASLKQRIGDSGVGGLDAGVLGAVGVSFGIFRLLKVGAEARYLLGLRDLDADPVASARLRETQFLLRAGLSL